MDAIDDIEEISRGVRPSSHGAGSAVSASPMDDAAKRGMYRNLRWLVNQASDMLARKISTRAAEALAYNGLVQSWPEIARLAREPARAQPSQGGLFETEE